MNGVTPEVVTLDEGFDESTLLTHDETNINLANMLHVVWTTKLTLCL